MQGLQPPTRTAGAGPASGRGIVDHYHEKLYLAFKSFPTIRRQLPEAGEDHATRSILDQAQEQGARGCLS